MMTIFAATSTHTHLCSAYLWKTAGHGLGGPFSVLRAYGDGVPKSWSDSTFLRWLKEFAANSAKRVLFETSPLVQKSQIISKLHRRMVQ